MEEGTTETCCPRLHQVPPTEQSYGCAGCAALFAVNSCCQGACRRLHSERQACIYADACRLQRAKWCNPCSISSFEAIIEAYFYWFV